jgi:hypothetical protein
MSDRMSPRASASAGPGEYQRKRRAAQKGQPHDAK